jgi:hypothetical protein
MSITWTRENAGRYSATVAGHRLAITGPAFTLDRRWRVYDRDTESGALIVADTLARAQDWVRRTFTERRWSVGLSNAHFCIGLVVEGEGQFTHHDAIAEAGRLEALAWRR